MQPKLVLLQNDQVVAKFALDQEIFTIGRKPENDMIIDHTSVSSRHARILVIGSDVFIEDMQSTNGTLINNKRIQKHMLADGDQIIIGQHMIKFDYPQSADEPIIESKKVKPYAVGLEGNSAFEEKPEAKEAEKPIFNTTNIPKPDASDSQIAQLQMVGGPNNGKKVTLTKAISRLGAPGEQVAVIARRPGGYYLMHLGGNTEQPILNGEPVSTQATLLADEDIIEVGRMRMKFLLN